MSAATLDGRNREFWSLKRWLREPFVHFLGIGAGLLALYYLVAPPHVEAPDARIELTQDDLRQIDVAWTAKWQRRPTSAEMQGLVEAKVREEVLYREALALGLDQEDTIVKRRLAQKLEFLTEDTARIRDPTAQELEAWFARNAGQFAAPGRVTFRHVYFSPDQRGARAAADAASALAILSGMPAPATELPALGDRFFDRSYYAERTPDEVAALFGTEFSRSLYRLPSGTWQGPIESGLGWHLVWIDALWPRHVPSFAEADPEQVKAAWIDAQRAESRRAAFEAMRAKYDVVLPGADAR
jgi:hypothetical protein